MNDRPPIALVREVRDDLIRDIDTTARSLLLSDSEQNMEKAVRGLDTLLDVAETMIAALSSSSSPGYARRDMDQDVVKALDSAKATLRKLRTLYYPKG